MADTQPRLREQDRAELEERRVQPRPKAALPPWLSTAGTRGSIAALWTWLRASGINAPRCFLCQPWEDPGHAVHAALVALGTPCILRVQTDQGTPGGEAEYFACASVEDARAVVECMADLRQRVGGAVVVSEDQANGRIGIMMRRCEPVVVHVMATQDTAMAQQAHMLMTATPAGRTQSLQGLDWQLGKIYRSTRAGPTAAAVTHPDDDGWVKVHWGTDDAEAVVRRAELTAWLVHTQVPSRFADSLGAGMYAVSMEFCFGDYTCRAASEAVGRPESDLEAIIVSDVQPLGLHRVFAGVAAGTALEASPFKVDASALPGPPAAARVRPSAECESSDVGSHMDCEDVECEHSARHSEASVDHATCGGGR